MNTQNVQSRFDRLALCSAILFALLQPAQNLFAQNPAGDIKFEHLGQEQGLSQTTVQCILQDQQGFMWFGTFAGLNKYDGYNFTAYRHDPNDPNSLSHSVVLSLYEDRAGVLWIGTGDGGLNKFDREKGTPTGVAFTHYKHDPKNPNSLSHNAVFSLCEDPNESGVLWIATYGGGLDKFDRDKETFTHYQHDPENPNSLSQDSVLAVYADHAGILWIGTYGGGLDKFDRKKETFTHYQHDPKNSNSLSSNYVAALHADRTGMLWIGTDGGLNKFDREKGTFTHYQYDPKDPDSLSDNRIRSLYEDQAGVLWIGTDGGGLDKFDREKETFTRYQHDPKDPNSLSHNFVWSLYADRAGVLWIGTRGGGLDKFDREKEPFANYQHDPKNANSLSDNLVWSLYEDRTGVLWIGTGDGGLNKFDREKGTPTGVTFTHYQHDPKNPNSLSHNAVFSPCEDPNESGVLWIATGGGGLNKFDREKETFTHYQHDPKNPNSLSGNSVGSLYADRAGVLWIGTAGGGLNKFDREKGTFTRYQHDPNNPNSLSHNDVSSLYEDSNESGVLWIGTYGGLNKFEREKRTFTHYQHDPNNPNSLSHNAVWSLYIDSSGVLWIGTESGLNKFDREKETFARYTVKDGLPDNSIYGILEDSHGNLWISTLNGLAKFNPQTNEFRIYGVGDGLPSNEFNSGAYHKSRRTGEMFFGGVNGFTCFHPDSVKDNPYIPPVVFTAFKRYNADEAGGKAIVETGISVKHALTLSYKDNVLAFEFAALNYRKTHKNQYAYKLEGFSDNWIQLGTKHDLTLTGLDPGEYTLRVKGSNNDGVWNEEGAALKITITPPWWRTKWAYGFYGLLFLAGIVATDRVQRRRLIRQERERTMQRELEQARELEKAHHALQATHEHLKATQQQLVTQEKLASLGQLTAGIAHEIKNPLNFVNNFAALSIDLAKELREEIAKIEDGGLKIEDSGSRIVDRESLLKIEDLGLRIVGGERLTNIKEILETLEQNAEKINHHGKRADGIVKSMMQHARGSSGQRESADINHLLDEAVNLTYHGMRANDAAFNITIEKDYDESIGKLEVVPQDISRVFLNVLNNACYATQKRKKDEQGGKDGFAPTLSVSTKNLNGKIEIRIRDNGNGIPFDIREKIFNPFFTTKPTGQGTGLGLSISYDIIVQQHRGEIQVETEEGKFTEFVVRLPRA